MNCPYCGREIREGEKFCQNCGAPLTDGAPNTAAAPAIAPEPAVPAVEQPPVEQANAGPAPSSLKEFIHSPFCPEKISKSIRTSWILLFVCASLTLVFELIGGIFPIDAILLVICAVWLKSKYSPAPAIAALALGVLSMVVGLIQNGTPSGILIVLAGSSAFSSIFKAKKLYESTFPGAQR